MIVIKYSCNIFNKLSKKKYSNKPVVFDYVAISFESILFLLNLKFQKTTAEEIKKLEITNSQTELEIIDIKNGLKVLHISNIFLICLFVLSIYNIYIIKKNKNNYPGVNIISNISIMDIAMIPALILQPKYYPGLNMSYPKLNIIFNMIIVFVSMIPEAILRPEYLHHALISFIVSCPFLLSSIYMCRHFFYLEKIKEEKIITKISFASYIFILFLGLFFVNKL